MEHIQDRSSPKEPRTTVQIQKNLIQLSTQEQQQQRETNAIINNKIVRHEDVVNRTVQEVWDVAMLANRFSLLFLSFIQPFSDRLKLEICVYRLFYNGFSWSNLFTFLIHTLIQVNIINLSGKIGKASLKVLIDLIQAGLCTWVSNRSVQLTYFGCSIKEKRCRPDRSSKRETGHSFLPFFNHRDHRLWPWNVYLDTHQSIYFSSPGDF